MTTSIINADPKPVIIQIRYSLLNKSMKHWVISRQDFETYSRQLFNPARLSLREEIFRSLTIPSLSALHKNSSSQHLRILVYTSANLPEPYLRNLQLSVEELGCGEVLVYEEDEKVRYGDKISDVLCNMVNMSDIKQKLNFAAVRLDDDDALPTDYIDRLSKFISDCYSGFAVSFGRGYVGQFNSQSQRFTMIREVYQPKSSCGLAVIGTYDKTKKSFSSPCHTAYELGKHALVDQRFPTIINSREPGFFRSAHYHQDTANTTRRLTLLKKLKNIVRKPRIERNEIDNLRDDKAFQQRFGYIPLGD